MQASDVPLVAAIEAQVFPYPWGEQAFSDCLRTDFLSFVLTAQDQILGYAIVMKVLDESQLLNIAIDPKHQAKQYGLYLLSWILAYLAAMGTKEMFLEVRPSNLAAIKLYEKVDFKQIGRRKNYYPAPQGREDAILYKKELRAEYDLNQ